MQNQKPVKVICPNHRCRNVILETAREGGGRLVVRYKQIENIGGHPSVQCRRCGTWIKVTLDMI
jgi:hypothetical protein